MKLKAKIMILVSTVTIIISLIATHISGEYLKHISSNDYMNRAKHMSNAAVSIMKPEDIKALKDAVYTIYENSSIEPDNENEAYLEQYSDILSMPEYRSTFERLRGIQKASGVDHIYIGWVDSDNNCTVYIISSAENNTFLPGMIKPLDSSSSDLNNILKPQMSKLTYGSKIASAGVSIYGENGDIIGYAGTEIYINPSQFDWSKYVRDLFIAVLVSAIIMSLLALVIFEKIVLKPIKKITNTAKKYSREYMDLSIYLFDEIEIKTKDEIHDLLVSVRQMEHDVKDYYLKMIKENNEQAKEIATKDELTGIRNKIAYSQTVSDMAEEVNNGFEEFAIGIVDLNNLKDINEIHGDECGNEAIKSLCNIVCTTFKHSPVFRYGGDEFVVILKGQDFNDMEYLDTEFNKIIDDNIKNTLLRPWERFTAALGIAIYNPKIDTTISDTFSRAYKAMDYKKGTMKAINSYYQATL